MNHRFATSHWPFVIGSRQTANPARSGHSRWAILAFLAGSVVLLWLVADRYLIPAVRASHNIDAIGRKELAALSALVLAVVLICLLAGLILIVRPGRFFLPRQHSPRTRTPYVDAWGESAKRIQPPP
jgi:hypothetical protein